MIGPLDRVYEVEGSFLQTSGYHGLVTRTLPEGRTVRAPKDPKRMGAAIEAWRSVTPEPRDVRELLLLVEAPPCAECHNRRRKMCGYCSGTGRLQRRCDHCDDVHECRCDDCDGGYRECACARPVPIVLFGHGFNRWLVADLLEKLGLRRDLLPAVAGVAWHESAAGNCLLVRHGDTVGICMPMSFSEEELSGAPRWGDP